MGTRLPIQNRIKISKSGAVSVQLLVFMVPVFFGFMGFAIDLGQLYLVRGELNQAANAMALAAAQQLNGTSVATDTATAAANLTLNDFASNGIRNDGNTYFFGNVYLNQGTSFLSSTASAPAYYSIAADAIGATGGGTADGTTAQYAQANITADAPLIFWSFLAGGQTRKTSVAASALAGVSAPLCTICGSDIIAIQAVDQTDPVNWGLTPSTHYTFGYSCNGGGAPGPLTGDTALLSYLLLNRYDLNSSISELNQLFNIGARGLAPSADPTQGCMTINASTDVVWATAQPGACRAAAPNGSVQAMLCGLTLRLDSTAAISTYSSSCALAGDLSALTTPFPNADSDVMAYDDYTQYTGNNQRVLTVAVVDALSSSSTMNILGFRQFLLEPTAGLTSNNPTDPDGRFSVLYIGNPLPVKQGRFDGGCGVTNGPGKVVLFQ